VEQGRATVVERIERDGRSIQGTSLPPPREETAPLECQSAHGGLVRVPLVALLVGIHPRPEGRPERFGCPLDVGVPEARGTLEAPVPPGLRAAPFGHRGAPGLCVACGGGGRAVAWCAAGDAQPGGAAGARAWEGLAPEDIGRVLRARRHGRVKIGAGVQGATELGNEGLPQERLGHDDACIGRAGGGGCAGLDTRGDALGRAHVRRPEAGCAGGTARAWRRRAGRPAPQEVAKDRGVFLRKPG